MKTVLKSILAVTAILALLAITIAPMFAADLPIYNAAPKITQYNGTNGTIITNLGVGTGLWTNQITANTIYTNVFRFPSKEGKDAAFEWFGQTVSGTVTNQIIQLGRSITGNSVTNILGAGLIGVDWFATVTNTSIITTTGTTFTFILNPFTTEPVKGAFNCIYVQWLSNPAGGGTLTNSYIKMNAL